MATSEEWSLKPLAELQAAADNGDAKAQYELGRLYTHGLRGLPSDGAIAVKWFRKAADLGWPA